MMKKTIVNGISLLACASMLAGTMSFAVPVQGAGLSDASNDFIAAAAENQAAKSNAQLDAAALYFPSYNVYGNLYLPSEGKNGSSITWSSSNSALISDEGQVNRPAKGSSDEVVMLTASVFDGSQTVTKDYEFTVVAESAMENIKQFNLDEVSIVDEYYYGAQESDIEFLKMFDNDRILYRFRETAGLDTAGAKTYGGWEDSLIAGHSVGHYLTAVAQAVLATGDQELKTKLEEIIHGLKECQDEVGTGFIFGAKLEDKDYIEKQFDILEGKASGGTWVPWYTMHKILAGLVDTYRFTGNEEALEVASSLGDWIYNRVGKWSDGTKNRVLGTEYGGMNDCLYDLYSFTHKEEHKLAAEKFDEPNLYKIVLDDTKTNTVNKRHANTTIPKFVGALKRYEVLAAFDEVDESAEEYLEYAKEFFTLVSEKHAYITGGTSDMEHFRNDNSQDECRTQCNNESCCAYNLLKLSRELFKITGEKKYADYYENTLRNAIMGAVNIENGSTTYFTPMATGYFKTFCADDPAKNMFWCCTGSGMENFTKLGDSIYFKKDSELFVNQYVASVVNWKETGMKISQESDVLTSDEAKFTIDLAGKAPVMAAINLRVPDWIAGTPVVMVNGTQYSGAKVSSGYIKVERQWSDKDVVTIKYPMEVKAYGLPDNSTVYGFKYGPTVLAAKLGKEEMNKTTWAGANLTAPLIKVVGNEQASLTISYNVTTKQVLGSETLTITEDMSISEYMESINTFFERDENEAVPTFRIKGTDADDVVNGGLTFVPFNTLNDERYGIYWYFESQAEEMTPEKIIATKEEARFGKSIIDSIQPGYGQYENDAIHQLKESSSVSSTIENGGSTRHAQAGGYFTYNMIVNKDKKNSLLCQFAKADEGKTLKISVGDKVIKEYTVKCPDGEEFYKEYFEIPADIVNACVTEISVTDASGAAKKETVIPVKFESADSSDSARLVGGLYMTVQFDENASISALTCEGGTVVADGANYKVYVPTTSSTAKFKVTIADKYGLLYVGDRLVNDAKSQKVILTADTTPVKLKVFAEDHKTSKEYTVTFIKGEAPANNNNTGSNNSAGQNNIANTNALADAVTAFKQTGISGKVTAYKGNKINIAPLYTDAFNKAVAAGTVSVKAIEYTSSSPKVVKVSGTTLKAVKKGNAVITVKLTLSTGDLITLTTKVTVKNPYVKISGKKIVKKGKTITLKAKGYGVKGKVKWSVDKKSVAKISKGKLKGLKKGTVKVTAKIGSVKNSVKVKVK